MEISHFGIITQITDTIINQLKTQNIQTEMIEPERIIKHTTIT